MDQLKDLNLPEGYEYLFLERQNEYISFRIKGVDGESSAKEWISKLSIKSRTTWRVLKTYPSSGKINIYRIDMRCQHATDPRVTGERSSKNTNCKAQLHIIVKRFVKNSKAKSFDQLSETYPTIVSFKGEHNHPLSSAAVLKYRDISEETKEELCKLFRQGHGPSAALHYLKMDLALKYQEQYFEIASDGYYVPSVSKVDKLYSREYKKEYGSISEVTMQEDLENNLNDCSEDSDITHCLVETSYSTPDSEEHVFSEEMGQQLMDIFQRIKDGAKENPIVFVPAIEKMLRNAINFASTDAGLVSALHTFGIYNDAASRRKLAKGKRKYNRKCIGVQPAVFSRLRMCLSRPRNLPTEQPDKVEKVRSNTTPLIISL